MVNAHKLGLRLQWWPAGVPVGGLLVGVTGVEHGSLVKGATGKLKADGQAPREATGNRQSGVTRQVEGPLAYWVRAPMAPTAVPSTWRFSAPIVGATTGSMGPAKMSTSRRSSLALWVYIARPLRARK